MVCTREVPEAVRKAFDRAQDCARSLWWAALSHAAIGDFSCARMLRPASAGNVIAGGGVRAVLEAKIREVLTKSQKRNTLNAVLPPSRR
jgi:ribosomal protein S5